MAGAAFLGAGTLLALAGAIFSFLALGSNLGVRLRLGRGLLLGSGILLGSVCVF
jgi:hypothetical protein